MSKIQIWKRITTEKQRQEQEIALYLICQRYKFESESQRVKGFHRYQKAVFNMSKIQIWKRITTGMQGWICPKWLYLICQRYKFESESQQYHFVGYLHLAVFNMSKIQIWKRITTAYCWDCAAAWLYLICQRYKFESESQHKRKIVPDSKAVFNMSKIQIWKRITTLYRKGISW